jgi:CRISPR-associated protein Cmr6
MDEPNRKEHTQKDDMLDGMCQRYEPQTIELYQHAFAAWKACARNDSMLEFFEMTLSSRLICGMGNKNVQECGATFLMPYGVPVIPGSAVKGIASAFAHGTGGNKWQKSVAYPFRSGGEHALLVFGGLSDKKKSYAAGVDCLDAWWMPNAAAAPFEKDILTPHNKAYLTGKGDDWPDGTENPVPVHFLAIKAGEKFLFGVRGPKELRDAAKTIIRCALVEEGPGIGSKTRLGYGRFTWAKSESEKAIEAEGVLAEFYDMLCDPAVGNTTARRFVKDRKLDKSGFDKTSDMAQRIYAKAKERFPESGWPDKIFNKALPTERPLLDFGQES